MVVQIVIFIIDSSASMNQMTYLGTTLLDVAKNAIESFIKIRSRDSIGKNDRYMLINFEDSPNCIKAGWKENHSTFLSELKYFKANSLTKLGYILKETFDLANVHRFSNGLDNYGMGRNPFFLEPVCIILLTDGCSFCNSSNIETILSIPPSSLEGKELTKEPFRWDQRLFSMVLRLPGIVYNSNHINTLPCIPLPGEQEIINVCDMTGGKAYVITSHKSLNQCLESIAQKLQIGVIVNFELMINPKNVGQQLGDGELILPEDYKDITRPNVSWHLTKKLIYVKHATKTGQISGHWPIPEDYRHDPNSNHLPTRNAIPKIYIDTKASHPYLNENFPFDKYELEPSPLTQYILNKKQPHQYSWQCFIHNSGLTEGISKPFGYLRASSAGTHVNLFVMPFDYPVLLILLEDLVRNPTPSQHWIQEFHKYIAEVPVYYIHPLKNAFRAFGISHTLIPPNFDSNPSYSITAYLKKIKRQSKIDNERTLISTTQKSDYNEILTKHEMHRGASTFTFNPIQNKINMFNALNNYKSILLNKNSFKHCNRFSESKIHNIPIAQMGNYQDYQKKSPPLRELEFGIARSQLFGSPFKSAPDIGPDDELNDTFHAKSHEKTKKNKKVKPLSPNTPPRPMTPPPILQYEKQKKWLNSLPQEETIIKSLNNRGTSKNILNSHITRSDVNKTNKLQPTNIGKIFVNNSYLNLPLTEIDTELLRNSDYALHTVEHARDTTADTLLLGKRLDKQSVCWNTYPTNKYVKSSLIKRPNHTGLNTTNAKRQKTETMITNCFRDRLYKHKQLIKTKENIRSEIRKLGKNYDQLFEILEGISEFDQKLTVVEEAIIFAEKFKKTHLTRMLRDWKDKISHS